MQLTRFSKATLLALVIGYHGNVSKVLHELNYLEYCVPKSDDLGNAKVTVDYLLSQTVSEADSLAVNIPFTPSLPSELTGRVR